ncbi:MAG: hypothetical protein OFPI_06280 [Osedax symbiont Rs2]|nr:MAG: hypothetical protein OFPI_06280 [Osedax symbiont Rs2]
MNRHKVSHKQTGAALIIGLIFLLLMSIVGLTSLQRVTIQERVTGNSMDNQRAFQAAEIALSNAELLVQTPVINGYVRTLAQGQASDAELLSDANWVCDDTSVAIAMRCIQYAAGAVPVITGLDENPRMKFEQLAANRYLITVWASGIGRAKVLLQSEYSF